MSGAFPFLNFLRKEKPPLQAVMDALKDHGAAQRMAERVAERAPLSFDAYRPDALARAIDEAASAGPGGYTRLAMGRPSSFLDLASPMSYHEGDLDDISALAQMLRTRRSPTYSERHPWDYYPQRYGKRFEGFGDVPFLSVGYDNARPDRVRGHEGRHRMAAIQEVYGDQPLAVRVFDTTRNVFNQPRWTPQAGGPLGRAPFEPFRRGGRV